MLNVPNDENRLSALHRLGVLDTPAEERFDQIVRLAAYVAGTPIALLSLLDLTRQWFKARVGLEVEQTPREQAFCEYVVSSGQTMWVADAVADVRFRDNPLVTGAPNIRFYCGAPVRLNCGTVIGTVCVIDTVARAYDRSLVDRLEELAAHAAAELERSPQVNRVREAVNAFAKTCEVWGAKFDPAARHRQLTQSSEAVRCMFEFRADDAEAIAGATPNDDERQLLFQISDLWKVLARTRKLRDCTISARPN